MSTDALVDDLLALRADVIAAGFVVLPRKVLELIQPLPDSVTAVVINKVLTCEPQPRETTPHQPPSQPPKPSTPEPDAEDSRSVAEVLAAKKAGQPVPTGLELAQQIAAGLDIPEPVAALMADTGYSVQATHRGIEVLDQKGTRIAVVTQMPQAELLLAGVRVKQLQEMAS